MEEEEEEAASARSNLINLGLLLSLIERVSLSLSPSLKRMIDGFSIVIEAAEGEQGKSSASNLN